MVLLLGLNVMNGGGVGCLAVKGIIVHQMGGGVHPPKGELLRVGG